MRPTAHGLGLTVATAVTVASSLALWALDRQVDRSTSAVAQLDVRFGWLVAILAAAVAIVVDIIAGDRVPPPRPMAR